MKHKIPKIGKKIKQLREYRGLTREQLAFENDIAKSTITCLERDEFDPKLSTLIKIAKGLNTRVSDLLSHID